MLKHFKILTVTHRKTNLKEIGQFVVSNTGNREVDATLKQLKKEMHIDELMYLPTCNRVMYFFYTKEEVQLDWVKRFLQYINPDLDVSDIYLNEHLQIKEGNAAIQHLHEVAASVDSMVIGEREILRQIREGYEQSKSWGLTGDNIRLAMRTTVEAAKEVYSTTRIGEKPISVVSLAIQKLLETNLSRKARILLIGAGQTNTLVAKFLKKHQFDNVIVFNRSLDKAINLANFLAGKAYSLNSIMNYREGFDAIIVCTGATEAIIDIPLYHNLLNGDTNEKIIVDLSIPNNVSEKVVQNFDVNYIEIEDLRQLSEQNKAFRTKEIGKVKTLLEEQLDKFELLYQQRKIERAMSQVPLQIKAAKEKAINEIFKKQLDELDDNARHLVQQMMDYMEKRCIGIPMKAAKETIE